MLLISRRQRVPARYFFALSDDELRVIPSIGFVFFMHFSIVLYLISMI
ncbi:hypothetical protein HMPREF7545_0292 [Selenomonas noxia ATCC 43541]|nr:hypothetical protein HMPREF7545_0292 [Selenomonas noxia ATCC 43541]